MFATEVFARYAARSCDEPLAAEVMHHAKRAVIDWHASLYPGLDAPAVRALEAVLADDLDRGNARLVRGRAATPRAAALIQGTAAHAAEIDDSFRDAMVHPGAATIAAALAAAQSVGADGSALPPWRGARLRGVDAHRRRDGSRALQVLAQHRHDRQLRRRRRRRCTARSRRGGVRPCARARRHLHRRTAAGVPIGGDGQAAACGPRRRGRLAGSAARRARRAQFVGHPRRRGRPGEGDEHRARLVAGRRDARPRTSTSPG